MLSRFYLNLLKLQSEKPIIVTYLRWLDKLRLHQGKPKQKTQSSKKALLTVATSAAEGLLTTHTKRDSLKYLMMYCSAMQKQALKQSLLSKEIKYSCKNFRAPSSRLSRQCDASLLFESSRWPSSLFSVKLNACSYSGLSGVQAKKNNLQTQSQHKGSNQASIPHKMITSLISYKKTASNSQHF